jgi:hypothetical protein
MLFDGVFSAVNRKANECFMTTGILISIHTNRKTSFQVKRLVSYYEKRSAEEETKVRLYIHACFSYSLGTYSLII